MGKEEDSIEFLNHYKGMASKEVMSVIHNLDWDSLHIWGDCGNALSDVLQNLYEGFLSGNNVETLAGEIVCLAEEIIRES